ncbi:MAG: hypothetical protein GEU93_21945 [Propionibacteriales bacterium]|nr:hypothetical protein [Propionibacteriales bacterium]
MLRRENIKFIVLGTVFLMIALSAPAIGHGVQHALFAHNSDKVDGKHAVGSGAGLNQAQGKVVAHNGSGKLPAKFIPKVQAAKQADNTKKVNGLPAQTLTGQFYVMGPASGSGQFFGHSISFGFSCPRCPSHTSSMRVAPQSQGARGRSTHLQLHPAISARTKATARTSPCAGSTS